MKLAFIAVLLPAIALAAPIPEASVVKLAVADDPTVAFRLWFKVGSQDDPPGKEGLAEITARMLAEGSTKKNRFERIREKLFPLAASYGSLTGVEMTILSGRAHRETLKEYVPLFLDAVLRPAFSKDDLERIRGEALSSIETTLRYASDEELGKAVLGNQIFAGTPYGHLGTGTVQGLKSITLDDVRRFYREHFTRDNLVIGIGGGYPQALVMQLEVELGRLPAGARPAPPAPAPTLPEGTRVTIVEKDTASTAISIGFPIDVLRGQREFYALAIANSWLGEHRMSTSHLYGVLREARGLNYGDYSYIEHLPSGGGAARARPNAARRKQIFEIWIRPVPNAARHFALRAALRELALLVDKGLSRDAFDRTRTFLSKYVRQYASTTMDRLAWALDDRFYDLDESHLERFRRSMGEITQDEVNAAIRKQLASKAVQVVIVTKDAAALRDALVADAPSPMKYESPKPAALLEEDKQISSFPLKLRPSDVTIVKVEDLFSR